MKALKARCCIIFIPMAVAFSPARADYHYASHEGSNEYPYTSWETAADSIWKAIDASSPHDTVFISSGEWLETVETGVYDSVAIIGMGIDSTFWNGDTYRDPILMIDYGCSVEHITFCHLDGYNALFGMPYAGVIIRNCRFRQSAYAIQASGGHTEITNCIFDTCRAGVDIYSSNGDSYSYIANNLGREIHGGAGGGIGFTGDSVVVERNIIIDNENSITGVGGTSTGTRRVVRNNVVMFALNGISVPGYYVGNNTIIDDFTYPGGWTDGIIAWHGQRIFNNSITGLARGIQSAGWADYNNLWANYFDFYGGEITDSIGNIYREPMFVDPDSGDFRLQAYSPLIDAGDPEVLDVDGSRSDIGAYGGPGGCSYTYLDLAPQIPDSITVEIEDSVVVLNWRFNTEADFNRYQIFRDIVSGFEPSEFNMIAEPDTSYFEDGTIEPGTAYYYRLTSVDNQGNVSDYSEEVAAIPTGVIYGDDGSVLPRYTVIESAYPNPFNSNVTIVYSASNLGPQPPQVRLQIFDIQGRLVKTLVDERKPMGTYRAVWDGTDDVGWPVASGVYMAKVFQWGSSAGDFPVKITLVK